jgi:hypothetical protein
MSWFMIPAKYYKSINISNPFIPAVFLKHSTVFFSFSFYYSPVITLMLKKDRGLRKELSGCTMELLPFVKSVLDGQSFRFDERHINRIKLCLENIKAKASNGLQKEIEHVVKELEENRVFKQTELNRNAMNKF